MTDFQKFLNGEYTKNLSEIEKSAIITAHKAKGRIISALGDDAGDVLDEIEAHYCDRAYHSYMRGFKDGVRFLLNTATA